MTDVLDNIAWHALSASHAHHSIGTGEAKRYVRGFAPILAFSNESRPNLEGFESYCDPMEVMLCKGWTGNPDNGWVVLGEQTGLQMVWSGGALPCKPDSSITYLDDSFAGQIINLVEETEPGPFGPRNIELGDFVGIFNEDRLVAIAGERLHAGRYREIATVCTKTDFRGRGLAQRLVEFLVAKQLSRGELPFLQVMASNVIAQRLYATMGFSVHQEAVVRALARQ